VVVEGREVKSRWRRASLFALTGALSVALVVGVARATVPLVRVSSDPFTNPTSQHATEVEPDTFAFGSTIVSAFQTGRFFDGGASDVGFATSTNGGSTWTPGVLPGITVYAGGPYARATDPSVAYDARHGVWLISTLTLGPFAVLTSRSTDGLTWSNPVLVSSGVNPDKNWIVCDNSSVSPFYGNCYTEWDNNGQGNLIQMSTSSDGGLTWGPPKSTADSASGLGGQPLVKRNGVVIVPIGDGSLNRILYFKSKNGGASWSSTAVVAPITDHQVAGNLRSPPLPSAEIDKGGKVYVVWADCRFRASCASNDIVMATIKRGVSPVQRIPIDPVSSTVDHFIPGLAVNAATTGSTARLALTYYYYPVSSCGSSCQLRVGFISSNNGGLTWSAPTDLAGPMNPAWLANTNQGRMVGDYISTSFVGSSVRTVFAVANPPVSTVFDEAMYAPIAPLSGSAGVTQIGTEPVLTTTPDHPPRPKFVTTP
jgi:hypothetical protein